MSWTKLDDRWTEQPVFDGLSHAARWHYLCLIQLCSRSERLDGRLTASAARRASDVDEPAQILSALAAVGLVVPDANGYVLPQIGEHVPPPHVRNAAEANRLRQQRHRAHKAGDHSLCLPDNCADATPDVTPDVTRDTVMPDRGSVTRDRPSPGSVTGNVTRDIGNPERVTRDTGTGRDGTGRALTEGVTEDEHVDPVTGEVLADPWADPLPNCRVCGGSMARIHASIGTHPGCDPLVAQQPVTASPSVAQPEGMH